MTNATTTMSRRVSELKANVDKIFDTMCEDHAHELVLAALEMRDDVRSAHDLAVEFDADEDAIRGIQHF